MVKHRFHSIEFKRQVAQEFLAGETLHGLAKRHDISRNLVRVWVGKYEAGAFDEDAQTADLICQQTFEYARVQIVVEAVIHAIGQDDQIGGRCLAGADGREIARLSVDGERIARVTLKTGVIHNVFDGVIAEGLGNNAAVEQADAALADKGVLGDLHVNHLLTKRRPRAGRLMECMLPG